jgi:hypothetical protein
MVSTGTLALEDHVDPKFWARYMDDVLAVVDEGAEETVLKSINGLHPKIKFTMEKETNGTLPFLDLKIIRSGEGFKFGIYRKPTSTQQYIPSSSNHPWSQKMSTFNSMLHRLCTVPLENEEYQKELQYIMETAIINGYNKEIIKNLHKRHQAKKRLRDCTTLERENNINDKKYLVLPFIPEYSYYLEKVFKKFNIEIAYDSLGKLGDHLGNLKDKIDEMEKSGIYKIVCAICRAFYIGQSKRRVGIRYEDHLGYVENE